MHLIEETVKVTREVPQPAAWCVRVVILQSAEELVTRDVVRQLAEAVPADRRVPVGDPTLHGAFSVEDPAQKPCPLVRHLRLFYGLLLWLVPTLKNFWHVEREGFRIVV